MKITPKPTPTTFTDLIDGMELNHTRLFLPNCTSGVRSAIYRIQQRTDKRFSTRKFSQSNQESIEVTRIK